jgi:hypothetical protein
MARDGAADVSRPIRLQSSKMALGTAGRRAEKRANSMARRVTVVRRSAGGTREVTVAVWQSKREIALIDAPLGPRSRLVSYVAHASASRNSAVVRISWA